MVAGGGAVTSSAGFAAVPCGGDSTHSSPVTAADTTAMSNARKPSDTRRVCIRYFDFGTSDLDYGV